MLKVSSTKKFKKDLKKHEHNKTVVNELHKVLVMLRKKESLPRKYKDHLLSGKYIHARDCHILNDLVLIYRISHEHIFLERIGSHSELF